MIRMCTPPLRTMKTSRSEYRPRRPMNRRRAPSEQHRGLPPEVFARIVERVPMTEAAARYGLTLNLHGTCCCPFHSEKTPSFKVYPGTGGFYCFGCGAGGDVVTFVEKLFGLSPAQAAKRLDADFSLGLFDSPATPDDSWKQRKAQREQAARAREEEEWQLILALRELHHLPPPPETDPEIYAQAKALEEYLEYVKETR